MLFINKDRVLHRSVTDMFGLMLPGKDILLMAKQLIEVDYRVMAFLSMMSEHSW